MPLILLVDDSPTHVAIVRQSLQMAGYRGAVAATGRQALQVAREIKPELLLMEVVMPDMNGYQTTRKLPQSKNTQHTAIMLASYREQESDQVWGSRQGAVDYVANPFSESVLREKVRVAPDSAAREAAMQMAASQE